MQFKHLKLLKFKVFLFAYFSINFLLKLYISNMNKEDNDILTYKENNYVFNIKREFDDSAESILEQILDYFLDKESDE